MCIHTDCPNYVKDFDMCLVYADLGLFNVSQYDKCLDKIIWEE